MPDNHGIHQMEAKEKEMAIPYEPVAELPKPCSQVDIGWEKANTEFWMPCSWSMGYLGLWRATLLSTFNRAMVQMKIVLDGSDGDTDYS